ESGDVEEVAAVFRDEAVDDENVGAEGRQAARERRADEAEPSGDEHRRAAEDGEAPVVVGKRHEKVVTLSSRVFFRFLALFVLAGCAADRPPVPPPPRYAAGAACYAALAPDEVRWTQAASPSR